MQPGSHRLADIDVLRAVAVLFTITEHLPGLLLFCPEAGPCHWPAWYHALREHGRFWTGVDLFFAISGFVIARAMLEDLSRITSLRAAWDTIGRFWMRRAFRILPAAWTWLALVGVMLAVFGRAHFFAEGRSYLADATAIVLQVANFRKMQIGVLGPYWSLALEMQFYLLFPIVVVLLRHRRRYMWAFVALAVVQLPLTRVLGDPLLMVRTDAIALGVLVAALGAYPVLADAKARLLPYARKLAGPVLVLALAAMAVLTTGKIAGAFIGIIAVISALLVWVASWNADLFMPRGVAGCILLWIGTRSYALYLANIPCFYLTRAMWGAVLGPGMVADERLLWPYVLTGAVVLVLAAELTWRFIEQPGIALGRAVLGQSPWNGRAPSDKRTAT